MGPLHRASPRCCVLLKKHLTTDKIQRPSNHKDKLTVFFFVFKFVTVLRVLCSKQLGFAKWRRSHRKTKLLLAEFKFPQTYHRGQCKKWKPFGRLAIKFKFLVQLFMLGFINVQNS